MYIKNLLKDAATILTIIIITVVYVFLQVFFGGDVCLVFFFPSKDRFDIVNISFRCVGFHRKGEGKESNPTHYSDCCKLWETFFVYTFSFVWSENMDILLGNSKWFSDNRNTNLFSYCIECVILKLLKRPPMRLIPFRPPLLLGEKREQGEGGTKPFKI